jgi:hypothetical protein
MPVRTHRLDKYREHPFNLEFLTNLDLILWIWIFLNTTSNDMVAPPHNPLKLFQVCMAPLSTSTLRECSGDWSDR